MRVVPAPLTMSLASIQSRFPQHRVLFESIRELRERASAHAREPFFEPKMLVELGDQKPRLLTLDKAQLNAWRQHIADATSVRMLALEDGVFAELASDRLTAGMAIARAHMEVAGLAAYCTEKLYASGRAQSWDTIRDLVHKTYFGSSMRIQAKGTPPLEHFIRPEEAYPLAPGELVKAMDRFVAAPNPPGTRYQLIYGLLSEFAHPVMRGNKAFYEIVSENADGWFIRYRHEDPLDDESVLMALDILLANMRIGHACAMLLDLATVRQSPDGELEMLSPSTSDVSEVWQMILQQRLPEAHA